MYERVGISLVEVYERVRKSVTSVCKKKKSKGLKDAFYGCEKVEKTSSGFWFIHIQKTVHLQGYRNYGNTQWIYL